MDLAMDSPIPEAAVKAPRLVGPVKPIKQPVQGQGVRRGAGVFHGEKERALFPKLHPDLPARVAVFHGIVQQDGHQAPDGSLVPLIDHARLYLTGHRQPSALRQRLKLRYCI